MPINHLFQKPPQAWIWEPPMDSHQLHYFQQQGGSREQMFEKPLTPSDVGKLNRLVIPKQHAEKYFPLDSESGEKGLLLSFEDEAGKEWRFRYSYWTSSQSYVLTKGWSRFVKEMKLDAGDVVHFERHRPGGDEKLYIGCRRRGAIDNTATLSAASSSQAMAGCNAALPWSTPNFYAASNSYPTLYNYNNQGEQASGAAEGARVTATTTGNSKRLRLFGVNLECGPELQEPQHPWSQFISNSTTTNTSSSQL